MRDDLQLMNIITLGIRIECLVIAHMRHASAISLDQKGCDDHEGEVVTRWPIEEGGGGREGKGIGGDPRLWDHISFSRTHDAVLSPAHT
jgi:hypothetical protein